MTKLHHFKQRVPAYIDIEELLEFDFNTVEELEQHPFVQKFLNIKPSSYLCKIDDCLMVVSDEGFSAWCIGRIATMDELKLPTYEQKFVVQYSDGRIEVKTENTENRVVSVCGDKATLEDGTKCKDLSYEDWKKLEETK
jgi:hypothetical protein